MTGIIGLFKLSPLDYSDTDLVRRQAQTLSLSTQTDKEFIEDERFCSCVARHIDLSYGSSVAVSQDSGIRLVLDGELSLDHGVSVKSEASYCLQLFEAEGVRGFARLNGSFSIVLYDRRAKRVLLVTDRCWSRPLFYYLGKDFLLFGSQVRTIAGFPVQRRLEASAVFQFFTFQTVLDDKTFLRGVLAVPPGACLSFSLSGLDIHKYWTLKYEPDTGKPLSAYTEELAESLRQAVRRRLKKDDGVGVLLSGGLDSRAVLACADREVSAITFGDFENREMQIAKKVAAFCSSPFFFIRRPDHFYANLPDTAVALSDGLYRFDHAHFALFKEGLPNNVKILLSGYGFDHILKGATLPTKRLRWLGWPLEEQVLVDIKDQEIVDRFIDLNPECLWRKADVARMFRQEHRRNIEEEIRGIVECILKIGLNCAPTPTQRFEYISMHTMAKGFSNFLNVLSIRNYARDRMISFDNEIIHQHLKIPPRLRLNARAYKSALKHLNKRVYKIEDANTGFQPGTPPRIQQLAVRVRSKLRKWGAAQVPPLPKPYVSEGSWPDLALLIRYERIISERLKITINDPVCINPDLFDVPYLNAMLAQHMEGTGDHAIPLLLTLTFGTWARSYGL